MERNRITTRPKDLITSEILDANLENWAKSVRGTKSPITDEYFPVLKRLVGELVIPSMNSNRGFDLDALTSRELTPKKILYEEIIGELPNTVKNVILKSAKKIATNAYNEAMKIQRQSASPLVGTVPGDPELTDPRRGLGGVRGGASYANWDAGASRNGYDQGLGEAN